MKQIKFSKSKKGIPSYCRIEDFISKERSSLLLNDLIDFNKYK